MAGTGGSMAMDGGAVDAPVVVDASHPRDSTSPGSGGSTAMDSGGPDLPAIVDATTASDAAEVGGGGAPGDVGLGSGGAGGQSGTGGSVDGGVDAPTGCNCAIAVQFECRQNGVNVNIIEYSIKVVNTGAAPVALKDVTVRYWYTIDGTGAQAGVCTSAAHPCTIAFQTAPAKPTSDHEGIISFTGGTLAPGDDTGEIQVQMYGTGFYTQTNDYSFSNTGAVFVDDTHLTGYVADKLLWGAPP
ncbi:MAG TPA: cellulose binding domain-containing protein [Polyangia bacterium]|nr:cellulose binding domain-containing protein [Polyangia bacterium]